MAQAQASKNAFLLLICIFCLLSITPSAESHSNDGKGHAPPQDWLNHGGDMYNRRYASGETKISPSTASNLRLKWKFYAGRDISATPAIFDGKLYFPSWNGYLYALRASNGSVLWKKNLQKLTGLEPTGLITNVNTTVARATPTVAGDLLIVGIYGPAVVIAVKRSSGKLVWATTLDRHPAGVITMSGTLHKGGFYVGTSSLEEEFNITQCCTFRGSFAKLRPQTGAVLWQTFLLPNNHGRRGEYAGAAVWGSSPAVDPRRSLVFVATGNLYSVPFRIRRCQEMENNQTVPKYPDRCVEPDNHSDSILGLDLGSGKIKWFKQLAGYDVWFSACSDPTKAGCPPGPNPDADFGEAPMVLKGRRRDAVVAVQKSGFAWALDPSNGSIIWSTLAGPGGLGGGGTWGAATDGKRVYTNIVNSGAANFTLKPTAANTTGGGWVAMDARTGKVLWSTADPNNATANGPVTVANGVVFAGSTYKEGPMYAMSARNGKILWSYKTRATVYGGASVSDGCVYVGSGFKVGLLAFVPTFVSGTTLYAFCVE
ncbi:uncharacterized protein LOC130789357 [Actinidia eriantha]|uniref:uncharacterized protein LOC130789357 n=1 Tax=Actinidia eriantha TaxID=165200 RepID=UPI00258B0BAD|nr:uncharacterized protein LOC130789357 [Actinidia eriantha]